MTGNDEPVWIETDTVVRAVGDMGRSLRAFEALGPLREPTTHLGGAASTALGQLARLVMSSPSSIAVEVNRIVDDAAITADNTVRADGGR